MSDLIARLDEKGNAVHQPSDTPNTSSPAANPVAAAAPGGIAFEGFRKIPRLSREIVITEKIDGTNGCIYIGDDGAFLVGSRTRWITPQIDNHGFAGWCYYNRDDLMTLGPGRHFGEWWGSGIQRGYGLEKGEKRFSLFNVSKWADVRPACCGVVPVLYAGAFSEQAIDSALERLRVNGSLASPGFMSPEGIIVYHTAGNLYFKKTLHKDDEWKGKAALRNASHTGAAAAPESGKVEQ